jgi:hypothetical protein
MALARFDVFFLGIMGHLQIYIRQMKEEVAEEYTIY